MGTRIFSFAHGVVLPVLLAAFAPGNRLMAQTAPQPWVCGLWTFQEKDGDTAPDSSPHGNHGKILGARRIESEQGAALQFTPQARSRIKVPHTASLDLAETIEIQVDVKTYGPTGRWQGILAKRNDANQKTKSQYQLALTPEMELTYGLNVGGPDNWWHPGSGFHLKPNQWYHITARYDALLRQAAIEVDGKPVKTLQHAPVTQHTDNPLWIGWTGWDDEFLNGELRQVRIADLLAQRIGELKMQGIKDVVLLKSTYLPHQFRGGDGGLQGTVETVALNPADRPEQVTLRVKFSDGQEAVEQTVELPAAGRGVIRCLVPEPVGDTQAQIVLVEDGKAVATQPITLAGSQSVIGFQGYVVSHTHSDFAWADSIAGCLNKNVEAVAKSVELAEKYPDFRFCMEHMLAVREFLRRNPEKLETVRKLMRAGRFEAGAFFTGPWELTAGAEGLVRQLYLGKLWVRKNLGIDPVTVWNVDVAGHTAQLPQILRKAGIRGLVISAGSEGPSLFNWQARDGSSVPTWSTPWWYNASGPLGLRQDNLETAAAAMPRFVADVCKNAAEYNLPKVGFIADGTDIEAPSERVVENIRQWNAERRYPPLTYSSTAALFEAVQNEALPAVSGEMPSPWDSVQSQGNECFMVDRRLDGRVLAAEKFAAFCSVVVPAFAYPHEQFNQVWENRLYTFDHNWGGTHGEESNRIKAEMIQTAARITDEVLGRTLQALAGAIDFKKPAQDALPVVVFNSLSWDRKDVVTFEIPAGQNRTGAMTLVDSQGRAAPYQFVQGLPGGVAPQILFCAEVPSLGYATYYATWDNKPAAPGPSSFSVDATGNTFENGFYRLQLDPATGGISGLIDKQSGKELVRQGGKYACNELVAFEDDAEDIKLHLTGKQWLGREHPSTIKVVESGPVRLVVEIAGSLLDASTRQQQIILYAALPRVDLLTKLDWEGKRNVHLYQAFPLNVPDPAVRYAVPYGWEQYGSEMKYAAPWPFGPVAKHRWRGVRGWVELANGDSSVTLASQCNYTAFKDLSAAPEEGFLIQPLLLRTVRSCGGGGKQYYEQKGRHEFRFALQAQADPTHLGEELDSPLLSCVAPSPLPSAPGGEGRARGLPDRLSFLGIQPANVHVAAVKQGEDGQGLILRLVELKERARATKAELRAFRPIKSAARTSIIEDYEAVIAPQDGTVTVPLAPAGIETLRIAF